MKLTLYMKSGNTIAQRGVKTWEGTYQGNEIKKLAVTYKWWTRRRLNIGSTDLSQIEALVQTKSLFETFWGLRGFRRNIVALLAVSCVVLGSATIYGLALRWLR